MKITTIRYRRLQSHNHGYGHDAVEAEAQVEAHETTEEALGALQAWVHAKLGNIREVDSLSERLVSMTHEIRTMERRREEVASDIKRGRDIIRQHEKLAGLARENALDVPPATLDVLGQDIPF